MSEQNQNEEGKSDEIILLEVLKKATDKNAEALKDEEDETITLAQAYLASKSNAKNFPKKYPSWL